MTSTCFGMRYCDKHGFYNYTVRNGVGWPPPCPQCEGDKMHPYDAQFRPDEGKTNLTINPTPSPLNKQVGGSHYKDQAIQPVEYIHANKIGYFEGNVIKYVTRWRNKNGVADLEKAKHYIDLLIELESKNARISQKEGTDPSTPRS